MTGRPARVASELPSYARLPNPYLGHPHTLMLFLGVSDLGRNPSVALFDDRSPAPLAAIEEDKLARHAHNGVPRRAIEYCLGHAGARVEDLTAIGIAGRPRRAWLREQRLKRELAKGVTTARGWSGAPAAGQWGRLQLLRELVSDRVPIHAFEHHRCHAAGAYYSSNFDSSLVLTLDGAGDMLAGLVSIGEGSQLRTLRSVPFPNSFGWLYGSVTELLGFRAGADEHRTQWLGCTGEPAYRDVFESLFGRDGESLPVLDPAWLGARCGDQWRLSGRLRDQLELTSVNGNALRQHANVARSLQDFLEDHIVALAEAYRVKTRRRHLCLSGGVFLNGLLVHAIEKRTQYDSVFVQSSPDNPGTAIGAGFLLRQRLHGDPQRASNLHVHLGPEFSPQAIKDVLDNCKLIYRFFPERERLLQAVVELLAQDKIVAWFQGRMEFGHRALGNRSILASPFAPYVKENLNQFIKHRQEFHPFVLSVPEDAASQYFDATPNCRFATSVAELKPGVDAFERFTFGRRRVRLHVADGANRFDALLRRFGRVAPAPVLLNTSFNLFGEPLVCDPRSAVRSFYCSGIDALAIGDFLVVK
jgi:carbamoyltransferase